MRRSIRIPGDEVDGCVWVEPVSGLARLARAVPRFAPDGELAARLIEAIEDPAAGQEAGRPARVAVDDVDPALDAVLDALNIRRVPLDDVGPAENALKRLQRHHARGLGPGYLTPPKSTPDLVARLYGEAALVRTHLRVERLTWRVDGLSRSPVFAFIDPGTDGAVICLDEDAAQAVRAIPDTIFDCPCIDLTFAPLDRASARVRIDVQDHDWLILDGLAPHFWRADRCRLPDAREMKIVADVLESVRLFPGESNDARMRLLDGRRVRVRLIREGERKGTRLA